MFNFTLLSTVFKLSWFSLYHSISNAATCNSSHKTEIKSYKTTSFYTQISEEEKKSIKNTEKAESSSMKGTLAMKIWKSRQTFAFVACDTIRNTTGSASR